jgi:hypothetical protein
MTATNYKKAFDRLITDRLIPEFCQNPKKPLAPESFKSETLSNVSEYDARYFLMAIKTGLIEHQGCGHYKAPLSGAAEQFFWEGPKTVQPQLFTLWVEPIITVAGLARLHLDHGWPKRFLGMQPDGWAFDLVAMYPGSQTMFVACEVKKTAKEVQDLLAFMRELAPDPAAGEPKTGKALNAYKKILGLRKHRPQLFWALGPNGLSKVFHLEYGAGGQIELMPTSESALRFPGANVSNGGLQSLPHVCPQWVESGH